ncbi:MAG: hypothetical protein LBQ98_05810 [Nitrososphaerota archaeon]|jgi:hypothetical protein|nr:hypothetical protein [Nitrososphaerota archaeon]
MGVFDGGGGVGGCWVEVKPLITSELGPANFVAILDALYDLGKPYRFLMVDTKDSLVRGRQLVRFFFQFPDPQTQKLMSNIIKTLIDVEVTSTNPPEQSYLVNLELELAKNYALSIINWQEKHTLNFIDRLVASIAGSDSCIEIVAQADPNAALNIQNYLFEKIHPAPSIGKECLNQGLNLVGTISQKPSSARSAKPQGPSKFDPDVRESVKDAKLKLCSKLFTCQIVIRSNCVQTAQTLRHALPACMNQFRTFRTQKKLQGISGILGAPSRYVLRNNVFCRLWWGLPLGIVLFGTVGGLFDPLDFIGSSFKVGEGVFLCLIAVLAVCLFVGFRKRYPIVLCTQELVQIIGLPTATEKLSIPLGRVPLARMQLGSEPRLSLESNFSVMEKLES